MLGEVELSEKERQTAAVALEVASKVEAVDTSRQQQKRMGWQAVLVALPWSPAERTGQS